MTALGLAGLAVVGVVIVLQARQIADLRLALNWESR